MDPYRLPAPDSKKEYARQYHERERKLHPEYYPLEPGASLILKCKRLWYCVTMVFCLLLWAITPRSFWGDDD